jgi:hypothetical protein
MMDNIETFDATELIEAINNHTEAVNGTFDNFEYIAEYLSNLTTAIEKCTEALNKHTEALSK